MSFVETDEMFKASVVIELQWNVPVFFFSRVKTLISSLSPFGSSSVRSNEFMVVVCTGRSFVAALRRFLLLSVVGDNLCSNRFSRHGDDGDGLQLLLQKARAFFLPS